MQARTPPQTEADASSGGGVVEREVETVRTRQAGAGAPVDAVAAPRVAAGERSGGYLETLPERLRAVMVVMLTALEGLLAIRFLLLAFGANVSTGFGGFIDDVSWPFVRPFASVFSNRTWDKGVVEISTLLAMGVYLLVFALIAMLFAALAPRLTGGAHDRE
ncbi:MAG: hypothetical protein M3P30_14175 [Chloroflexota bacterium]|nr:hypothetical protein [Chloroflexota bacterium]